MEDAYYNTEFSKNRRKKLAFVFDLAIFLDNVMDFTDKNLNITYNYANRSRLRSFNRLHPQK